MLLVPPLLVALLPVASTYGLSRELASRSYHEGFPKHWTPAEIPYDHRSEYFQNVDSASWNRIQNLATIQRGLGTEDLKEKLEVWFACMERKAALLQPPIQGPGPLKTPLEAFLREELSQESMARMGRLADMCMHVVRRGYQATRAKRDEHTRRLQEAREKGGSPQWREGFPTDEDRLADIQSREDEAFERGDFNAFMSRIGKILFRKRPAPGNFAPPNPVGGGGFMPLRPVLR